MWAGTFGDVDVRHAALLDDAVELTTPIDSELERLLGELERRLRAYGAPIVDAFAPGRPADEIRAAFDDVGLTAPEDVVTWWSWHDGAVLVDAPPVLSGPGLHLRSENTLVEDWHVLSLAEATRAHRWFRAVYAEGGAADLLPGGWFPIMVTGAQPVLWIDCAGGADEPAPLYVDEHLPKPEGPLFPSLAHFAAATIRAFDEGLIRRHPEDSRVPLFDAARLPDDLRRLSFW